MSTKLREAKLKSEFYKNALAFYRSHPEVSVCEANNLALERQMDLMLLPPTPANFERAYELVKDQLAYVVTEPTAEEIAARIAEEAMREANKIAEEARQQKAHEEDKALRSFPRHNSPFWTKERIKDWFAKHKTDALIPGSLEARIQEAELPPEMTREYLIHLPLDELRRLKRVHGLQRILDRIDGRDGK